MMAKKKADIAKRNISRAKMREDVDTLKSELREKGFTSYPYPRREIMPSEVAERNLDGCHKIYQRQAERVKLAETHSSERLGLERLQLERLSGQKDVAQREYNLSKKGIEELREKADSSPEDRGLYETSLATREERIRNKQGNDLYVVLNEISKEELAKEELATERGAYRPPSPSTPSLSGSFSPPPRLSKLNGAVRNLLAEAKPTSVSV